MEIDGLTISKTESDYIVEDCNHRTFSIDKNGKADSHWFCSYETLKIILNYVKEDNNVNNDVNVND